MKERDGSERFQIPPVTYTQSGGVRRAGFELEYAGVGVEASARIVHEVFGGEDLPVSTFVHRVENTRFGDFSVEIDTSILKEKRYESLLRSIGIEPERAKQQGLESSLLGIFSKIVPFEISTPPIPLTELASLERLQQLLRQHGAQGTKASLLYAFGLHINTEIPTSHADVLLNYLRSFLLLYPWIQKKVHVDLTRKLSPYIAPFPSEYAALILAEGYAPAEGRLIDDYLVYNPTRNRPLDMLPIFASLDWERVERALSDMRLIKPRPAFHYRMPNCLIDDPHWSIAAEWNIWIVVERLASEPARIEALSEQYRDAASHSFKPFYDRWPNVVQEYIDGVEGARPAPI